MEESTNIIYEKNIEKNERSESPFGRELDTENQYFYFTPTGYIDNKGYSQRYFIAP